MIYGSVCSGIEAATVAWHPLGWKAAWYAEIEKFPSAVLAHHYPQTPNLGDMTRLHEKDEFRRSTIDLLVGGTPCQSFSVAGLRKGLADPRGNLALVFLALAERSRAQWVVWENVPGILSSEQGRDFGAFLGGLAQLGYGWAYRVLDAQYFGVPQRRQRVFVVGYLGDWRPASAVLFESHCLSGHHPPRREARSGATSGVSHSLKASGGFKQDHTHETYVTQPLTARYDSSPDGTGRGTPITICRGSDPISAIDLAQPITTRKGDQGAVCYDMRGNGDGENVPTLTGHHAGAISDFSPMIFTQGNLARGEGPRPSSEVAPTFQADAGDQHPCVFQQNSRSEVREVGGDGQVTGAVTGEPGAQCQNYLKAGMSVRRLTPRECERLQGFPDDYTLIPYGWGRSKDGPRYKALGNSMAVPVMRWIGERIQMVESL